LNVDDSSKNLQSNKKKNKTKINAVGIVAAAELWLRFKKHTLYKTGYKSQFDDEAPP